MPMTETKKTKPTLMINKQIHPATHNPYFLSETVMTVDGPRSRLMAGRYETAERAIAELEHLENGGETSPEILVTGPHQIEIYGSNSCKYCTDAKELCVSKGLNFVYRNIDEDEAAFDELHKRIGTWKTVPRIFVDGFLVGGFDEFKAKVDG